MSKIKILVVPSDRTGVGFFRSTIPHINLQKMFPDDVHVDIDYQPDYKNDKWLKQYDIIHYHRTFGPYEEMADTIKRLENLGIPSIMDLDDHWSPGEHHPAYKIIKDQKIDQKLFSNIKVADNIMTTTSIFASEMGKYNKNVHVIPNAIDITEKQFRPEPTSSDRIRIGWLGGSSHLHDLEILRGVAGKLKSAGYMDKIQFVLCGFDLRGTITIFDQKTGTQTQRPIKPLESVWYKYEQIFTDNYTTVSDDYKKHLLRFKQEEYEGIEDEPYRRVWTKPITTYATNYNLFDVSLAPIEENMFNKVKSQLKVIEAGFHKKALIAQDFGPYQIDMINMFDKTDKNHHTPIINENANGFLVPSRKNHKLWFKYIKYLIDNPSVIKEMGEKLYDTVNGNYDMKSACKDRLTIYKQLIKEKKKVLVEI